MAREEEEEKISRGRKEEEKEEWRKEKERELWFLKTLLPLKFALYKDEAYGTV